MGKSKRESLGESLFIDMMKLIDMPKSAIHNPYFRFDNTLTQEQYTTFKRDSVERIQKVLKVNKRKAIGIFNSFYNIFGLRLKG